MPIILRGVLPVLYTFRTAPCSLVIPGFCITLLVGITDTGWALADLVVGVGPETPHAQDASDRFLDFLRHNAPGDWWGFEVLLRSIRTQPTRLEYGEAFRSARQWKESVAISAAQGYLARGREWGLVQPKMPEGRYALTSYGQSVATSVSGTWESENERSTSPQLA